MPVSVRLPDDLVDRVRKQADAEHRSVPKQIEHLLQIAQAVKENPDLPYDFIKGILESGREVEEGKATPFKFD